MRSLLIATGSLMMVLQIGCYDPRAQESAIVREVESNGSGNLDVVTLPGLGEFFANRQALAAHIDQECAPRRAVADAHWIDTAEGKTCQAAHLIAPQMQWAAPKEKGW